MSKSEIDQTKDGIIAITVCIAQILTESDPTFAARLEARLGAWSGALTEFGEGHGAALVWSVRQEFFSEYIRNCGPRLLTRKNRTAKPGT
jgi:hypothetical protein